jgi:aminopeptidase YwaD
LKMFSNSGVQVIKNSKEQLEDLILKDISKENLLEHVKWLCENASPRITGTPTCRQAAQYIEKISKENGVPVNSYELPGYICTPEKAEVKVIAPEQREIEAYVYAFTPSTSTGGLEAEVVDAGIGSKEDLGKVDVEGKICFVR